MVLLSAPNVASAADEAAAAKFRAGPRLIAIGTEAAKAARSGGLKLGTEDESDLIGVIGRGTGDARMKDTVKQTEALLAQICKVERKEAARAKKHFESALVGLAPEFKTLVK
jgi:hypothetical protein